MADTAAGTMAGTRKAADARTRVAAYAQRPANAPLWAPMAAMFARKGRGVWARRNARATGARGASNRIKRELRRVQKAARTECGFASDRSAPPPRQGKSWTTGAAHSEVRDNRMMATPLKTRGNAAVGSVATDARILTALFLGVIVGALAAMFTKHPGDCPVCACAGTA